MSPSRVRPLLGALALLLLAQGASGVRIEPRTHILIVGSSTAFPIVSAAAEAIGRAEGLVTPVVEATGTGGGFKLFCAGIGPDTPDIVTASRRLKPSERDACMRNGVTDIREVRIGYDGIVLAKARAGEPFPLTTRTLYLALAREVPAADDPRRLVANPHVTWRDVDPRLPDEPIRVLGPPPTSGTRDILVERIMEAGCDQQPMLLELHARDPERFRRQCHALREDGAFVNAGENDARMVRNLLADPQALGILGWNFLDRNRARLQAATIDGMAPTFDLIEAGVYPLSRPLYLYAKLQHRRLVPGLAGFVDAVVSPALSGPDGLLLEHGLIPLGAAERAREQQ